MYTFVLGAVTEESSLFHYSEDSNFNTYYKPSLRLISDLNNIDETERAEAEQVCGDNNQCIYDYVLTGSEVIARETVNTTQSFMAAIDAVRTGN